MNNVLIIYRQYDNATPQEELAAITAAYVFVRRCAEARQTQKKNDDAKEDLKGALRANAKP